MSVDKEFYSLIEKAQKFWFNSPLKALEYTKQAEKIINNTIDKKKIAVLNNSYGVIYMNLNELDKAISHFQKSLKIYKELKEYYDLARILNNIGSIFIYKRKFFEAIGYFEQAISFKNQSNKKSIAKTLNNLGTVYTQIGDYKTALKYYFEALKLKEEFGNNDDIAASWVNIAIFYAHIGDYKEALKFNEKALKYYRKTDDKNQQADILHNNAIIYQKLKNYKKAEELLLEAIFLKEKSGNQLGLENLFITLGNNYKMLNKIEEAKNYLKKAYDLLINTTNKNSIISCLMRLGDLYLSDDIKKSKEYYYKALDLSILSNSKTLECEIYEKLYDLYYRQKKYVLALENLKKYNDLKDEILDSETKSKLYKLKITYELEQKKKENEILRAENELIKLKLETQKKLQKAKEKIQIQSNTIELISKELEKRIEKSFIGKSKKIKEILQVAMKAAKYKDVNILITGESGTGKEIIARIIHYESPRKKFPFFAINSSAMPENLLESEFFGHTKGSFTGAIKNKKGYFELANNGTLFLDEVADMPIHLQSKLLRAIEEKKIKRVGDNAELDVDVRIISATNKNIEKLIEENKFRIDFYHRINTIKIHIPPLRERKEDIEPLLIHFVDYFSKIFKKKDIYIEKGVIDHLSNYSFPGNVRELKNMVERAMILSKNSYLTPQDFPIKEATNIQKDNMLTEQEQIEAIKQALIKHNFNQSLAAKELNISRDALIRKMKKFDLKIIKKFNK